jgi:very-short-patch-repair endonuclease
MGRLLKSRTILDLYEVPRTEEILARALRRAGIKFKKQYYVPGRERRYYLDFAVLHGQKKIAIECDNLKAHSGRRARERDAEKDIFLRSQGWIVTRLSEKEILENPKNCVRFFKKLLK